MNRTALIKLLFLLAFFAIVSCSSQGAYQPDGYIKQTTATTPKPPAPDTAAPALTKDSIREERIDGQGATMAVTGGSLVRVRTTSHVTFTGVVTGIDTVKKTISVKSTGKNMSFDLTNPVVRGYPNVSAIKTGDTITLGYIRNGIGIVKGENFHQDLKDQTAADELAPSKKKKKSAGYNNAKSPRSAPVRVKYRAHSTSFKDVDNNKDGSISPIELNTVIYGLTMEDFKKYDKNGDGGLNETEYRSVKKR